jgi:hypothetical protein
VAPLAQEQRSNEQCTATHLLLASSDLDDQTADTTPTVRIIDHDQHSTAEETGWGR